MKLEELPKDERELLESMASTCLQLIAAANAMLQEHNQAAGEFLNASNEWLLLTRKEKAVTPHPVEPIDYFHARYFSKEEISEFENYRNAQTYVPTGIQSVITGALEQKQLILGRVWNSFRAFNYDQLSGDLIDYFGPEPQHLGMIHYNRRAAKLAETMRSLDLDTITDAEDRKRAEQIQTEQLPEFERLLTQLNELGTQWQAMHSSHFRTAVRASQQSTSEKTL